MSPLFGKKGSAKGKTVLVVDVESGSVGAALVRLSPNHLPKVFGETRKVLPLKPTHDPEELTRLVEQAVERTLTHVGQVAARVRTHPTLGSVGEVEQVALFFSPPWGTLSIAQRELEPHPFVRRVRSALDSFFGPVATTTEPFGLIAAHAMPILFPSDGHYLLSVVSGEVTELILLENAGSHLKIAGHATLPLGRHYPLRTLLSHGGFSEAEARSALTLYARGHAPRHALEALHTASVHVANEFGSVAGELLGHVPARSVFVVSREPAGEWFARALAQSSELASFFPEAGEVRAVRASHMAPFVGVHARVPDTPLLLEALFLNARFAGSL